MVCVLRTHVAQMEVQSYLLLVLIVSLKIFMSNTATSVGVKKVQPILAGVNTRQRVQARVVQHHSVYCLVTSAPDLRSSVQGEHL